MSLDRTRSRSHGRGAAGATQQGNMTGRTNASITDFPLRILVSSEMVGAIIGRGGSTIRVITQATRARVDVHRKDNVGSAEKAITIYGNPENCSQACKKILEVMKQEADSTNKGEIVLKMLAHNSLIGRIIGKGGATIKKIMQDTDTKINVSSDGDHNVTEVSGLNIERVISIRGSIDGMSAAENLISNKLRTSYENDLQALAPGVGGMFPGLHPMAMISGLPPQLTRPTLAAPFGTASAGIPQATVSPYPLFGAAPTPLLSAPQGQLTQETVYMYIPNNAVGAVIGTKGLHIRNIIRYSGATVKIATVQAEKSEQPNERQVTITGTAEAQWKAQCMIFEKIREEGFVPTNEEPRLTIEISVPSSQVGRIIGKGGANVRELQRVTGSVIKFPSEPSAGTDNTNVHIYGSFYSVQSAQRRIRAMLSGNK